MNSYDFSGRVALVTGGASGIGLATARRLREGGAEVAVFDRAAADGFLTVTGDISRSADVDSAVARVERDVGPDDVLVNDAGNPCRYVLTVDD